MAAIPVGFRFHPTEEEIISHYLKLRIMGYDFRDIIPEIDVYQCEPCDLPDYSPIRSSNEVWYFFCRLDYNKYRNSKRPRANRATKTGTGFWKVTSQARNIKARGKDEVIGTKKTLAFHYKFPNSNVVRTSWLIHEYQAQITPPDGGVLVLCKLKNKVYEVSNNSPCDDGEPSCFAAYDVDFQTPRVRIIEVDPTPMEPHIGIHSPCLLQSQIQAEQGLSSDEIRFVDSLLDVPDDYCNENTALAFPNRHTHFTSDAYVGDRIDTGTMVVPAESTLEVAAARNIEINRLEIVGEPFPGIHKAPEKPKLPEKPKALGKPKEPEKPKKPEKSKAPEIPKEPKKPKALDIPKEPEKSKTSRSFKVKWGASSRSRESKMSNRLSRVGDGESTKHGTVVDPWQKFDMESEIYWNMLMVIQGKPDIKSQSSRSAGTYWKGPFIHMEMPPSSQAHCPPLVYLLKALLGLVLFIFCIWGLLIPY